MTTPAQYLFTRALDLPEADPARACGEDAELRLEVQRTLVGSAYSDSFFGDENGATLGAEEFKEAFSPPGDIIGPYKPRETKDRAAATCPVWTEFGLAWALPHF